VSVQYLMPCQCGHKNRVTAAQAGGQVVCVCGKNVAVPTLRGLRSLDVAPPEAATSTKAGWSRGHGAAFATGLLLAGIGIAVCAIYLVQYARIAGWSVDRTDDIVRAEASQIDKLTPVQMLREWTAIVEEGLGEKGKPIWVAAKEQLGTYKLRMQIGLGAIVIGTGLALAAMFVGRGRATS
jgi:hypothetical protein